MFDQKREMTMALMAMLAEMMRFAPRSMDYGQPGPFMRPRSQSKRRLRARRGRRG